MIADILPRILRMMLQENAELTICRRRERRGDVRPPRFRELSSANLKVVDAAERQ